MANIVVVDDDALFLEYLRAVLETADYSVRANRDGRGALDMVRRTNMRVDLWIVDIKMPQMNGYQFAETLRKPPLSSSTPILLLSAWVEGMPSQELQGVTYLDKKGCREPAFLDLVRKLVDERPNAGA